MKKEKQFTTQELKNLYWEFSKEIMMEYSFYSGNAGGGGGYTRVIYKNNIQDFLIWLAEKKM